MLNFSTPKGFRGLGLRILNLFPNGLGLRVSKLFPKDLGVLGFGFASEDVWYNFDAGVSGARSELSLGCSSGTYSKP